MKIYKLDIVDLWNRGETICITVSLALSRKEGTGDVTRGNARAMAAFVPNLNKLLGDRIMKGKGEVGFVTDRIIAFFTKPREGDFDDVMPEVAHLYSFDQKVPGQHTRADPEIVSRSARQLIRLVEKENLPRVFLPLPGVSTGGLDVQDIGEALDLIEDHPKILLISNVPVHGKGIEMATPEECAQILA